MPYAFTMDVPINTEIYDRIRAALGPEPPAGMLAHLVIERDGRLSYLEVWESEEAWERFSDERLHPVVWAAFEAAGISPRPGEPTRHPINVHDIWTSPDGA